MPKQTLKDEAAITDICSSEKNKNSKAAALKTENDEKKLGLLNEILGEKLGQLRGRIGSGEFRLPEELPASQSKFSFFFRQLLFMLRS